MLNVINQEILTHKRRPSEFQTSFLERSGNRISIAMEQKKYPGYYRHYIIDGDRCTILSLKIDQ